MKFCIVYRYIDLKDNKTKYIGIITRRSKKRCKEDRLKEHRVKDWWANGNYKIEYFTVYSRTDAEAFESHLIALYKTYEYYNKAKKDWGLSAYLPTNIGWIHYITYYGQFIQDAARRNIESPKYSIDLDKKYKVWEGKNGFWYTYIPDISSKKRRKLIKRKNKSDIDNFLLKIYG